MFKKLATAAALFAALGLAACGTTGGLPASPVVTTPPASTGDATTDAILSATVKACGFLPTVSTVTSIIASFIPGGAPINGLVTAVATSICNAVSPPKASASRRMLRVGPPMVNGVIVEGNFVQ